MKHACIYFSVLLAIATNAVGQQRWFPTADAGSITVGDWSFSWTIHGHDEGLVLQNVFWKGTKVLHKASMPVIRVKYRGLDRDVRDGCGPYADQIGAVKAFPGVPAEFNVAIRLWDSQLLELGVYDEIGGYDLLQTWAFHTSGWMEGMLHSRGWSCGDPPGSRRNHRHHPYWRFDFDVESAKNEVLQFRTSASGSTRFLRRTVEGRTARLPGDHLLGVQVRSTVSDKHVNAYIVNNEMSDSTGPPWFNYSNRDAVWRRYHSNEDDGWGFGEVGDLGWGNPPENINREDVVIWLVGHVSHNWDGQETSKLFFHSAGATIRPSW